MQIFISYSTADLALVRQIADAIRPRAKPVFWNQDKDPGSDSWGTIFQWIEESNAVLAVITGKVLARGASVNQELGYARKAGKVILPLVASDVPKAELGFLNGITWIGFDPQNPGSAITEVLQKIAALHEAAQKEIARKETEANQNFFFVLIIAGLALVVLNSKK